LSNLEELGQSIVSCKLCPRLVEHREAVARDKRPMYADWDYWGRPVPGFGDPNARLLILGLAPAAHGANRTGRMFTGDRSGDWVYGTLHKFGFSSSPESRRRDDGLTLFDTYITAALRCAPPANKPLPEERSSCLQYLLREFELLSNVRVVVALGKLAFDTYLTIRSNQGNRLASPRPRFGHGAIHSFADGITLISSYHPSQHNTLTGRLTRDMFEGVFSKAKQSLG
jgi:uracil-DNA glycosylase family 4